MPNRFSLSGPLHLLTRLMLGPLVICSIVIEMATPVAAAAVALPASIQCGAGEPGCGEVLNQDTATNPEQQLADMYVPVVMLKEQRHECDNEGEPYLPAPVEVVFDDPETILRQRATTGRDPDIMTAPGLDDLVGLDETYYLDFPGNARKPGCDYERWARKHMEGVQPVTYVNIVASEDGDRLAVQYWFWYVFNDFNNTHEGDWEMIQVVFDVGTVAEALVTEPVATGYSQHTGGEGADWNGGKLQKDGTHPIVYAAAGSHASKYSSNLYIAWGEDRSGVGCDNTTGPSVRIDPTPILISGPDTLPTGPLAWTQYGGRWGERHRAFFNGPTTPYGRPRWIDPFPWQDASRDGSITIPETFSFGPSTTAVFCDVIGVGSLALTRVVVQPGVVIGILAAIVLLVILLMRLGGRTVRAAWVVYKRAWPVFVATGLLLIPVGLLANLIQSWVTGHSPGREIFQTLNSSPGARLGFVLSVGGLQQFVSLIVVGPAIIEAVAEIRAGEKPTIRSIFTFVWENVSGLFRALWKPTLIILALSLSLIGIPWAIERTFRWWFVAQAVIIDRVRPDEAMAVSERVVRGNWTRTAGTGTLLLFVGVASGPLLGIILLMAASPGVQFVNFFSSFLYAFFLPFAVVGSTLLYLELAGDEGPDELVDPEHHAGSDGAGQLAPAGS